MPVTLIVNEVPFEYPIPGDSPGWGEGATGWAEEVTFVLNNLVNPNDILQTSFTLANNVTSPTNIVGMTFNTGQVRTAFIYYSVYRTSTSNPSGFSESGVINITYDNLASSGSKWSLIQSDINGYAGVMFSILDTGQVQVTSTNIGATGYSGKIQFFAKALNQ